MDHQLDLCLRLQELGIEHHGEEEIAEESSSWDNLVVEEVKGIIGYEFRNPNLLRQAFTHCSYLDQDKTSTASYERLEYLGDARILHGDGAFRDVPGFGAGSAHEAPSRKR
ncbi:UNVERIFIED_CONTAM: hypothetical protein Slati_2331200 [Sesamum latifolium]|uniref:RNase III domain-containing protein n=1 Tax=Sesamum latifolium TaxID=2727402 RepID=A0AAW2WDX8_9LAMI